MEPEMMMLAGAATVAVAPGWALVWIMVGKSALEMFQSADTQAITEKANPAIVPK